MANDDLPIPDYLAPADRELQRGEKVGEYVVEHKIGAGTFGDVYRAVQPLIGKQVAIKILSRRYSADPSIVSRFVAEARSVNQIRHKNIIDIFSFGQLADGRHYHIMELLEGTTLEQYLQQRGRLPVVEVILILRPLARAIDAAHACGIAHRDLKPANVFLSVDEDGQPFPKLLDFGIAKLMTRDVPRQHQTATGSAVGTPDYMSPEQCQGPNVDHRTDIYSFGVMTYQLLTGRVPYVGNSVVDVLVQHLSAEPPPPSTLCPDLPKAVDGPILWMLAKDRSQRPPSLAAAVAALEVAANSSGFSVPRSLPPEELAALVPVAQPVSGASLALADPELARTLPSGERAALAPVRQGTSGRSVVLAMLAFMALIGAFVAYVLNDNAERVRAAVTQAEAERARPLPAPDPPLEAKSGAPVPAPERKPKITIDWKGGPPGAEVVVGGVVLCKIPCSTLHEAGSAPIQVELRAAGYVTELRSLTPLADGELRVALKRKGQAKKKGIDELESFD